MSSTKEYRDFIIEQLSEIENVTCRPMMGEFLLYVDDILFGGIYDDRVLVKKTETNKEFGMQEVIPYESTKKTMYFVEDVDNKDCLKEIVYATVDGLKQ